MLKLEKENYIGIITVGIITGILELMIIFKHIKNGQFISVIPINISFIVLAWSVTRIIKIYIKIYGKKRVITLADIQVMEYQVIYPALDLKLKKENQIAYDLGMIYCHTKEAERGFLVKKHTKTGRKGTKFTYISIKSSEQMDEYVISLNSMIDDFNKKYNMELDLIKK